MRESLSGTASRWRILVVALSWAMLSGASTAQPVLYASDGHNLLTIDTSTFAVTTVGPMQLVNGSEDFHAAMSFDASGQLWSLSDESLYRIDSDNGQTSVVGGLNLSFFFEGGLAFHPTTGVAYGANSGSASLAQLVQVDLTNGMGTNLGIFASASTHDFNGIAFDSGGQLYGIDRPSNFLWRIDHLNPSGPGTQPIASFGSVSLGSVGGLTYDALGGVFWGYAEGTHELFTIDPSTGVVVVKAQFSASVPKLFAVAFDACTSTFPFGLGCAGSGGFVPELELAPCGAQTGQPIQLAISDALGGAQALLVFGLAQGTAPLGSGCSLLVQPLLPPIVSVPLGGSGPGNGSAFLSTALPGGLPTPFSFTMQAFIIDPGVPVMFSGSRGLAVTVES